MTDSLKQAVSTALQPINPDYAAMTAHPRTKITALDAPFLNTYQLYEILYMHPNKPILFYVGYAPEKPIFLITGQPANFAKLAQADMVSIHRPELAASYVATYLTVTRPLSERFYVVSAADAVKFRPNLDRPVKKTMNDFLDKYADVIQPPTATRETSGYVVTAFVVHQQNLEQHTVSIGLGNTLHDDIKVLESNLPLVYGL